MAQLALFPTTQRDLLEERYQPLFRDDLAFGKLVTYVTNKTEPIFGWFRYKEGFSRRLVEQVLLREWQLPYDSLVFDPFAGCGTTLLACQQLGYPALGTDIMPLAVFVSRVKLRRDYNIQELETAVSKLLSETSTSTGKSWPKVRIIDLAFSQQTKEGILFYRELIQSVPDEATRDFLMLGLLASIEEASYTSKDGQFLRLISRPPKAIRMVLEAKLARMLSDLRNLFAHFDGKESPEQAQIFLGDARHLPKDASRYRGKVAGIITSPPYLNRYDYSRTYALELCLLYDENGEPCVKDFEDLKNIRHSLLRSHIESRAATTSFVKVPALGEILENLEPKQLNNPRIPIMIEGYFEDMNLVIAQMSQMLKKGGLVALVVANARFEDEIIPVDLILSEIAASHGLETTEVRITRYKGNSSQQMGRYGRVPVRESIAFWRKR